MKISFSSPAPHGILPPLQSCHYAIICYYACADLPREISDHARIAFLCVHFVILRIKKCLHNTMQVNRQEVGIFFTLPKDICMIDENKF